MVDYDNVEITHSLRPMT